MISYEIERIPVRRATQMVVANHYLHRAAPAMFAFGLFDGLDMVGCIIYGKPASPSLCVGVCGPEESNRVIELTRLWIEDGTPKNTGLLRQSTHNSSLRLRLSAGTNSVKPHLLQTSFCSSSIQ